MTAVSTVPLTTVPDHAQIACLRPLIEGRRCVVIGAAPLATPFAVVEPDEVVVCVNGSISSHDGLADLWLVNSKPPRPDRPTYMRCHKAMLRQGTARVATHIALLRGPLEATEAKTLSFLQRAGVQWASWSVIDKPIKRWLEEQVCARRRLACSAGLFAVALALWCGAAAVRLVGFSWEDGYHYDRPPMPRGHLESDRRAIAALQARYPGRLSGALVS